MGSSVHVKEATIVTPSEPTPTVLLSLSPLDSQLFLRFTIEYLLLYKPDPGLDQGATTARLKAALAKALVPYYPLAGRVRSKLVDDDDDASTGSLEVVCRAQGVLFIEAVSDHNINEFENAPRFVTQWRNLLSFHVTDVLKGAPPVVVQLTWLNDGNVALGVGINHCLCDGIGSAEFLNYFAELASAGQSKLTPKPIWDRHLLNQPAFEPSSNGNDSSLTHPEFNRVPDLCGFMSRFSTERLVPTSFIFDKTSLNELKKIVFSKSTGIGESNYTSFEVLSAHIWRSWAIALNLPSNQILKLLFSINVRDRVKPRLPSGYYGNAFVLGCAQSSVKDLTEKGLEYAAMLVKRAKERVDSEFVKSVVESVGEGRASPDSVGVLILSQWSRLGLEKVELGGGIGMPVHVGPICCDRYCLLLPVINQTAAVKAMVAVPTTAAQRYESLLRSFSS